MSSEPDERLVPRKSRVRHHLMSMAVAWNRASRLVWTSPSGPVVCGGAIALLLALTLDLTSYLGYLSLARTWLMTGEGPGDFMPIGFTAFVYVGLRLGGEALLKSMQWLAYVSTLALSWRLSKEFQQQPDRPSTIPLWVITFHPFLLLNVTRVSDNAIAVPLFLATILLMLTPRSRRGGTFRTVGIGTVLGLASLVRPNLLLLAALAGSTPLRRVRELAGVVGLALTISAAGVWAASGIVRIVPRNGAYNFYAGANTYTRETLLALYDAEQSLPLALRDYRQVHSRDLEEDEYLSEALRFIRSHPLSFAELGVLKIVTLLRADQVRTGGRLRYWSVMLVQTLLTVPVPLAIAAMVSQYRRGWSRTDSVVAGAMCLYVLPFALTLAAPRLRLPLDIICLNYAVSVAAVIGRSRFTRALSA